MATKTKVGVRLSGRFAPGTEVDLYPRVGVMFDRAHVGSPIATTKVDKLGEVSFEDLDAEPGARFWIAGRDEDGVWRGVHVTAKLRDASSERLGDDEIRERLAQTRPPASAVSATTTTGPRSSTSSRVIAGNGQPFASAKVGLPTPKAERDPHPAPHARIEDTPDGTVLRSHTVTGESHPINPALPDGKLRQDQVPADVPQASCTPLGEATVIGDEAQVFAQLQQKQVTPPAAGEVVQTPGIDAAKSGKVPAESKRAAEGKPPEPKRATSKRSAAKKAPAKRKASSTAKKPAAKKTTAKASNSRGTARKASPKKS